MTNDAKAVADNLRDELLPLQRTKRMKVKTLMKYFSYEKRTEENTTLITELLSERNIIVHPSIMKIGDEWQLKFDDNIYLSVNTPTTGEDFMEINPLPENWNSDKWFDFLSEKEYRTEKEVESKFLVPLLTRLGYSENDRYDGMPVSAAHGSKATRLEVDYALFNTGIEAFNNQVLLIAEGKKFKDNASASVKQEEARNQVKSYAYWVSCHFGLIADSNKVEVISLLPIVGSRKVIFECRHDELKKSFKDLYKLIGKQSLTHYYGSLLEGQD